MVACGPGSYMYKTLTKQQPMVQPSKYTTKGDNKSEFKQWNSPVECTQSKDEIEHDVTGW